MGKVTGFLEIERKDRFKCNFWAHVAGVSGYLEIENPPYWAYLNLPNEC